jgi:DNA modification methylase
MTAHPLSGQSTSAPAWRIEVGDVVDRLRELPDESVQCVVTSPPYWGLRDYGVAGQIGQEPTLGDFIARLVEVFEEVRRVLRVDGTCWVNMGDAYASKTRGSDLGWDKSRLTNPARVQKAQAAALRATGDRHRGKGDGLKEKDLMGQPWRLAFALQDAGWWLRSEIVWHKPTPMPESVTDRPTRAHEQLFLFAKAPRYFYDADAIREPLATKTFSSHGSTRKPTGGGGLVKADNWGRGVQERKPKVDAAGEPVGANKRTVWTVYSQPYPEAHFATFPPALVKPCVMAGTSAHGACAQCGAPWRRVVDVLGESKSAEGRELLGSATAVPGASPDLRKHGGHHGDNVRPRLTRGWEPTCDHVDVGVRPCVVLDPFSGAGTTVMKALRHGRSAIGVELNPEYAALSRRRIQDDSPLLNGAAEEEVAGDEPAVA